MPILYGSPDIRSRTDKAGSKNGNAKDPRRLTRRIGRIVGKLALVKTVQFGFLNTILFVSAAHCRGNDSSPHATSSRCRTNSRGERDVHLIDLEGILLARTIGHRLPVAIEDIANKGKALAGLAGISSIRR